MIDLCALLVIRSLRTKLKKTNRLDKKLDRKLKRDLKRKEKKRKRKIKKAMMKRNTREVHVTKEGSLMISTAIPETTTQPPKDENWYSYVDFLRENKVVVKKEYFTFYSYSRKKRERKCTRMSLSLLMVQVCI